MDLIVSRISNNALVHSKLSTSRMSGGARRVMNTLRSTKPRSATAITKKAKRNVTRPLHSSGANAQSSIALGPFPHANAQVFSKSQIARPTAAELKTLFVASAVPMVGFGFMDNMVMIQAGQYIDSTIGVTMGLATLSAAAAGQVVSDVSGVVSGGTLERFLERVGLVKKITLSAAQRRLPICRNTAMAGAVIGVIVGCTLGASSLMFIDLEKRDRMHRVIQLRDIVSDMVTDDKMCTVHLASLSKHDFDVTSQDQASKTKIDFLNDRDLDSVAAQSAEQRESIMSDDLKTLCVPVVSNQNDQVIAVLEFKSSNSEIESDGFTSEDRISAKTMARHIAIFMDRMTE